MQMLGNFILNSKTKAAYTCMFLGLGCFSIHREGLNVPLNSGLQVHFSATRCLSE